LFEKLHVLIVVMLQAAPGMISTTADGWTVDTTKAGFLGVTAHWIQVKKDKWAMRWEVIGFRTISGDHSGKNLGRYFVGVCDRIGIINMERSKVRPDPGQYAVLSDQKYSSSRPPLTTHQVIQRSVRLFKVYMNAASYLHGPRKRINSRN
jgi:hypothetical protein